MLTDIVSQILGVLTIGSQIFIVLAILYFLFFRKKDNIILNFFSANSIRLSFLVALVATSGSLFYSTYAGFTPCELCWFQRIFMYPLVIVLGVGLIKNSAEIIDYSFPLAFFGLCISIYHNYIYYKGISSLVCTTAESCTIPYVSEFGYVGIPMMALTAFSLITLFLIIKKYIKR